LGLLYVAGALERAGRTVAVVDAAAEKLDDRGFRARVRELGAPVVGLSGMTPMRNLIGRTAGLVRDLTDRIVLGGVHATRFADEALDEFPDIDALVVGEGEIPAPALLEWWDSGEPGDPPPGVRVRNRPFHEASPPQDLAALPRPARHLVPTEAYGYLFQTRSPITTFISSRGCPFRCSFCDKTISGSPWRARPAEDVVDELQEVVERHGVRYVCIFDDNFTLRRSRVEAICEEIIRRRLDIHWKCEARVDGVTPDLCRLMHRAGCRTVAFGIESGNQESLDFLRKDQDLGKMRAAIAATRSADIETVGYVLVGIPGETPSTTMRTLDFALQTEMDFIQFSTLSPFPGTDLYDLAMDKGWFVESTVTNPVDSEEHRATLLPPGWSEADLDRTLRKLYGGFYLRPRWLARQAWRAGKQGTLLPRARLGLRVARWCLSAGPRVGAN
jgi:radical SAM superfamily enzyme YgiQ (UPF0313 family)